MGRSGNLSGEEDRRALGAIYEAAGGEAWGENWNTEKDLRSWWGVTADVTGRVTGLNLSEAVLEGSIAPEIGALADLRELHLDITGLFGLYPAGAGISEQAPRIEHRGRGHYRLDPKRVGGIEEVAGAIPLGDESLGRNSCRVGQPETPAQAVSSGVGSDRRVAPDARGFETVARAQGGRECLAWGDSGRVGTRLQAEDA